MPCHCLFVQHPIVVLWLMLEGQKCVNRLLPLRAIKIPLRSGPFRFICGHFFPPLWKEQPGITSIYHVRSIRAPSLGLLWPFHFIPSMMMITNLCWEFRMGVWSPLPSGQSGFCLCWQSLVGSLGQGWNICKHRLNAGSHLKHIHHGFFKAWNEN